MKRVKYKSPVFAEMLHFLVHQPGLCGVSGWGLGSLGQALQ